MLKSRKDVVVIKPWFQGLGLSDEAGMLASVPGQRGVLVETVAARQEL